MMKKITTLALVGFLFGTSLAQIAGTWTLSPVETSLAVGPAKGDYGWWKVPAAEISGVRACQFDDEFVFNADGTFKMNFQGSTFLEGWQGGSNACGTPAAPHDGSGNATWKYNATSKTVTVYGKGAYLGLAKVFNGGELAKSADAKDSITYEVTVTGNKMSLDISIGGGYWHFEMSKKMPALNPMYPDAGRVLKCVGLFASIASQTPQEPFGKPHASSVIWAVDLAVGEFSSSR